MKNPNEVNPPLPKMLRIEKLVLSGLMRQMAETFEMDSSHLIFFTTTNRMQIADRIAKLRAGEGATIKWPLVFAHLTGFEEGLSTEMHAVNAKTLAREGINVHMADTQNFVVNVKIVPVVFEVEIIYMSDAWEDAFKFACTWMAASLQNRMNFNIGYHNFPIDIRCKLSGSFSTPDRDEAVNQPNTFEYTGTLQIGGYVQAAGEDAISKVSIIRQVNTTADPNATGGTQFVKGQQRKLLRNAGS